MKLGCKPTTENLESTLSHFTRNMPVKTVRGYNSQTGSLKSFREDIWGNFQIIFKNLKVKNFLQDMNYAYYKTNH